MVGFHLDSDSINLKLSFKLLSKLAPSTLYESIENLSRLIQINSFKFSIKTKFKYQMLIFFLN